MLYDAAICMNTANVMLQNLVFTECSMHNPITIAAQRERCVIRIAEFASAVEPEAAQSTLMAETMVKRNNNTMATMSCTAPELGSKYGFR
jgi:hypothetical protein